MTRTNTPEETHVKHWQDTANTLLGAALAGAPWFFGFQHQALATVVVIGLGLTLVMATLLAHVVHQTWNERLAMILGVLVVAAPWMFEFDGYAGVVGAFVVVGLGILVLATMSLSEDIAENDAYGTAR
jgi:hypothetical protein